MASELQVQIVSHCGRQSRVQPARISEFENEEREPNLFVLIAYIRLGQVHMESLVDDGITGDNFHTLLGKEFSFMTVAQSLERQRRNKPVSVISGTR